MEFDQSEHPPQAESTARESPPRGGLEGETPAPSLKRRRSESVESTGKRRRTSQSSHEEPRRPSVDEAVRNRPPPRRPSGANVGAVEERKRGARLFGGILGVLSKNKTAKVNEKRAEVEKKQQEKLKSQAVQYSEDRTGRYNRGGRQDNSEQSMRQRHSRLLKMASYLQTRTTPRIYYKPWKLLPDEERRIKNQRADAEETIERETREREADEARQRDQRSPSQSESKQDQRGDHEDVKMEDDERGDRDDRTPAAGLTNEALQEVGTKEKDMDLQALDGDDAGEGGEVVVEAGEDTVIY